MIQICEDANLWSRFEKSISIDIEQFTSMLDQHVAPSQRRQFDDQLSYLIGNAATAAWATAGIELVDADGCSGANG